MGHFVETSGNPDMQHFYHTKISPFATDAIAKNDLHSQLVPLADEELKAFLFYKLSQAIGVGIQVDIDTVLTKSAISAHIELVDLVRILGILLDNAIEEVMGLDAGTIHLKIASSGHMAVYTVKNTIGEDVQAKGIRPGVSTKGPGRGHGLFSIHRMLEKYDHITLNSYFSPGNIFVQSLVINM